MCAFLCVCVWIEREAYDLLLFFFAEMKPHLDGRMRDAAAFWLAPGGEGGGGVERIVQIDGSRPEV